MPSGATTILLCRPPRVSAAFSPLSLSGLAGWWDASDLATLYQDSGLTTPVAADGDPVGGWKDKSGNARHLLQATASKRATYKTAQFSGQPVLRGDGVDDALSVSFGVTISQPFTLIAVYKPRGAPSYSRPFDTAIIGGGRVALNPLSTNFGIWAGTGGFIMGSAMDASTAVAHASVFDGASSKFYIGGGTATTGDPGSGSLNGFAVYTDGGTSSTDDVAEILLYSSALSLANLNALGAYVAAKWGVAWSTAS